MCVASGFDVCSVVFVLFLFFVKKEKKERKKKKSIRQPNSAVSTPLLRILKTR